MRDALDLADKRCPGAVIRFGGHAMAAGLTLRASELESFRAVFDAVCHSLINEADLNHRIETDGELPATDLSLELAEELRLAGPWGQGFPEPVFEGQFRLVQQRIVGAKHLKLMLQPLHSNTLMDAIFFNIDVDIWPDHSRDIVRCVYQLDVNEYRGQRSVQLLIRYIE